MMNLDIKNQLDPLLKKLADERNLSAAEKVATSVLELLNLKTRSLELLNLPRIDAELSRFELAPEFARQAAAFGINFDKPEIFDVKLFWIKKATKTNLSWLIGVTPNYEDSEANDYKNIGIDFVVPSTCDSLIILLSNRYKVRSLELKGHITQTQNEILSGWKNIDSKNLEDSKEIKKVVHSRLWDSFNFEPINRKFYAELVEHFYLMVNHLDKKYDRKASVMFTTRLIGRILFIWFLKKKNLIDPNMNYFEIEDPNNQSKYYRCKLEFLFFETLNKEISERQHEDKSTPYLNGGLFDIASSDFFNDKNLSFPTAYFNQLFEILGKYNFTIDESNTDFQQVAIDPEMLGRVFESLLAEQIDVDTGESKKKATGAYYTPREIVNYMCEESILEYLRARVPDSPERDSKLEELIRLPEALFRDQDQNKRRDWKPYAVQIIKALDGDTGSDPITILDPAVGSGAFPMGMLHLIIKIYGRLDSKYEKNISTLKKSILSKSLYGVDIESTAIEICRLRAWLSIIVDIPEGAEVEPLPNLDFKFICANTLIQLDQDTQVSLFDDHQLQNQLQEIRYKYYLTTNKIKKTRLQTNYQKLTQQQGLFDSRRTQQLKSYRPFDTSASSEFYDPELHHGVESFDVVIGNPPYRFTRGSGFSDQFKSDIKKIYESGVGKINLFSIFIEMGLKTLNPKGVLTYIIPNTLFRATPYKPLRKLIVDNYEIKQIVDLKAGVFENVTASTTIIEISNTKPVNNNIEFVNSPQELLERRISSEISQDKFKNPEYVFSIYMEENGENLFEKMNLGSDDLGSICSEIINGIVTPKGKDEFISSERLSDQYVPFLEGKDIDSYTIRNKNRFILFDRDRLHRARPQYVWDAKEKLIIRRIGGGQKTLYVTYDDNNFYTFASTNVILIKENSWANIKYVLCLLNSKLLNYYYIEKFTNRSTLTVNVSKIYLSQLPIKVISLDQQADFIELASRVLSIKKNDPTSNISLLEAELDSKIYNLYGLTEAEIKMVESSTSIISKK